MKRHVAYLRYIIRHKWFVFVASRKTGCSIYRAIVHDLSKFLPSEWVPYANTFYTKQGGKQYIPHLDFDKAWLHHQHCNKHHWQHWILQEDDGDIKHLEMPEKYVREMVADWAGAGKAITGKWEVKEWYANNNKMNIHGNTLKLIEVLLERF